MFDKTDFVVSNGIRHAVHRAEPSGPAAFEGRRTVLLIHGFLDCGATWELVAAPLARAGYAVLAPDLRGFGATGRVPPGGYYHFADYVADVDGLVEHFAPTSKPDDGKPPWLAVVGHSMGGGVAGLWAGTRPERLARLALVEGIGPNGEPPDQAPDRMRGWLRDLGRIVRSPRPLGSLAEAVDRLAAMNPRSDRAFIEGRAERLVRREGDAIFWAYDPLHRSLSPTPFQPEVFKAFLRRIACPTLFVSGGPLGMHVDDEAERLAQIRDHRVVVFEHAGHAVHWTAPTELAAELVRFFA